MSCKPVISLENLGKCYQVYDKPRDRLLQMFSRKCYYREFWAVKSISLDIYSGEVLGIVGSNGAGKSTLLQMVCGVLHQTEGAIAVNGRVAALLELGAGFNSEFTGRENVYLSASVMGMSRDAIDKRYDEIVEFSGIGEFIDQPLKTYSSGMYVRLAFSVATSIDPDILIIDEALSVGDGEFSRKSFDRIMSLKDRGVTILFCSHSLYQVEAFCDRVLWLDHGECKQLGKPQAVVSSYSSSIIEGTVGVDAHSAHAETLPYEKLTSQRLQGQGRIIDVVVAMDGVVGRELKGDSRKSDLTIMIKFYLDSTLPSPVVGVDIEYESVVSITTIVSRTDGINIAQNEKGYGCAEICLPKLALRKGKYFISVYLGCEKAVHIYDQTLRVATFNMVDSIPDPGLVTIPHEWCVYGQQ